MYRPGGLLYRGHRHAWGLHNGIVNYRFLLMVWDRWLLTWIIWFCHNIVVWKKISSASLRPNPKEASFSNQSVVCFVFTIQHLRDYWLGGSDTTTTDCNYSNQVCRQLLKDHLKRATNQLSTFPRNHETWCCVASRKEKNQCDGLECSMNCSVSKTINLEDLLQSISHKSCRAKFGPK